MIQRPLPLYRIDAIKDEQLPQTIEALAPHRDYAGRVLEQCPVYYAGERNQLTIPFNGIVETDLTSALHIQQLSPIHARSFEVVDAERPDVWQDEYGHSYSGVNLKGNNFSDARLIETLTASEGLIAYGLQESATIRRIIRGSNILRAAGINTEYILGVGEPQYYPTPVSGHDIDWHVDLTKDAYKQKIISEYWRQLPEDKRTPESLAELHEKFSRITFYITLRAMDTSYRLGELDSLEARKSVFDIASKQGFVESDVLDPSKPDDLERLMSEVTIPRLVDNFYKLHKLGLAHRFPVANNITALGSIIDLDSLHGEGLGLGDEHITPLDVFKDIEQVLAAISGSSVVGFIDFDLRAKYLDLFITLYAEKFRNDTEKPFFSLEDIAQIAIEGLPDSDEDDLWDFSMKRAIRRHLYNEFKNDISDERLEEAQKSMDAWADTISDEGVEGLVATAEDIIDGLCNLVCYEAMADNKLQSELLEAFMTNVDDFKMSGELLYDSLNEVVFEKFIQARIQTQVQEIDELDDEQKRELLYVWRMPVPLFVKLSEKFFSTYEQILREKLTPIIAESIIPDAKSEITQQININRFGISTIGVELFDFVQACKEKALELQITHYVDPLSTENRQKVLNLEDHDSHVAEEGSSIVEVITDGEITLSSYPNGENLNSMYVELSATARYVAFVEEDANGKKKVVLRMVTSEDADRNVNWDEIDDDEAILRLVNHYIHQERLFDERKYVTTVKRDSDYMSHFKFED